MDEIFTENKGSWLLVILLLFILFAIFFNMHQDAKILKFESQKKCSSIEMEVLDVERVDNGKERFVISCYKEGTDEIKRLRLFLE